MELGNIVSRNSENSYNATVRVMNSGIQDNSAICSDKSGSSRDGFLLTEALRTAQQTSDIRKNRVEELKARVSSGEYEIDTNALAEALVKEDFAIFSV